MQKNFLKEPFFIALIMLTGVSYFLRAQNVYHFGKLELNVDHAQASKMAIRGDYSGALLNDQVEFKKTAFSKGSQLINDMFGRQTEPSMIYIKKINLSAPVIYSTSREEKQIQNDMKRGVIHYPGTALPGQVGNVFITGHSSYYAWDDGEFKEIFKHLGQLQKGDEIIITRGLSIYQYEIESMEVVLPTDQRIFDFENHSDCLLTLATCWPVGSYEKRLMIKARQI